MIHRWIGTVTAGLLVLSFTAASTAQPFVNRAAEHVHTRLKTASPEAHFRQEPRYLIGSREALKTFYADEEFRPVWSDEDGPRPLADSLLAALERADEEGLYPQDYHVEAIRTLLDTIRGAEAPDADLRARRMAELDVLLSDAFLLFGEHLANGRIDPRVVDETWHVVGRGEDVVGRLREALAAADPVGVLRDLTPPHPEYTRLRQALAAYRSVRERGGWRTVDAGVPLGIGDESPRVVRLRARLRATGDLADPGEADASPAVFDRELDRAVRRFQRRHGLAADGVVGAATLGALNVPVEARIQQIRLNMERWRWIPRDLGGRYIAVNIAAFTLRVIENGEQALSMRTIVGRPDRPTPVFTGRVTHLAFNPYWYVPHSIAVRDELPRIQRDSQYLARKGIRVFPRGELEARPIDPTRIDWAQLSEHHFPYRLRQDPGPLNPLGRVKFLLPNPHDVYMHDTPDRGLFTRPRRSFSSGCVRLEQPIELALYLLAEQLEWTRERIEQVLREANEREVELLQSVPVYLLYGTAFVDGDGRIAFRRDIYERDDRLSRALNVPVQTALNGRLRESGIRLPGRTRAHEALTATRSAGPATDCSALQ